MAYLTADDINELLCEGEGQTVEFKRDFKPGDERILLAFANAEGGTLLIGVDDNGNVIGLSDADADRIFRSLTRIAKTIFAPPFPQLYIADTNFNHRRIIYATIGAAPTSVRPVTDATGRLYIRKGVGKVEGILLSERAAEKSASLDKTNRFKVFVAMSFRVEEEPALEDYFKAMERASKEANLPLKLVRVDRIAGDYDITQRIMDEISKADIVLADLTLNSHNVYFELGYARGLKKTVVLTARNDAQADIKFDVRNWHTTFYRNATELENKLADEFAEAYKTITGQQA